MGVPYVALQLIAAGFAFNILSEGMISQGVGMYVMGGIVIIYIFLGGLKSAAITDALQGALMFVALLLGGIYGLVMLGGPGALIEGIANLEPSKLISGPDAAYPWQTGATLLLSVGIGVVIGPLSLTWALSARSEKTIRFAGVFSVTAHAILYVLLIPFVGFVAAVLHPGISVADQVLPTLISTAPALLYAIVGVGIFAAINSTADAYLHASGAMTGHDLYRVLTGSTTVNTWVGRIAQLVVVMTGLIMVNQSQSTLVYLGALAGGLGMQTIPALMGAVFWKTFNKYGVFYGMIVGVLVTILTEFVWKHPFGVHSGLWGLLANFAVAYLLSVITKEVISDDSYEKFHRVLEREYGDTEETPSDVKMSV
ncbi:sodium:solute symporter family protein [Sutcliffiella cohnii]|uniref:sodium:solute symporter family protein n=1 Tax=Sutcliffiella cohnii TaxID=33932 RepID=UPI002E23AAE6|nr:sodium:solute symporter family protein [Sutcliffiella cohnii]